MLKITKTAISFEETELIELERIITDSNQQDSFVFLKKCVYAKIVQSQKGKLQSHLNGEIDSVQKFRNTK